MEEDAQAQIAAGFDNAADPSHVPVSTYELVGFVPSLHHGCGVFVTLEEPRNSNTRVQTIGCFFRISQRRVMYVYIIQLPRMIDLYLETNNSIKFNDWLIALGKRAYPGLMEKNCAGLQLTITEKPM